MQGFLFQVIDFEKNRLSIFHIFQFFSHLLESQKFKFGNRAVFGIINFVLILVSKTQIRQQN